MHNHKTEPRMFLILIEYRQERFLCMYINNRKYTLAAFINLKKTTFDAVNHKIFLGKLNYAEIIFFFFILIENY